MASVRSSLSQAALSNPGLYSSLNALQVAEAVRQNRVLSRTCAKIAKRRCEVDRCAPLELQRKEPHGLSHRGGSYWTNREGIAKFNRALPACAVSGPPQGHARGAPGEAGGTFACSNANWVYADTHLEQFQSVLAET